MTHQAMSPHDLYARAHGGDALSQPSTATAPQRAHRNLEWLQWLALAIALAIVFWWALTVLRPHRPLPTVPVSQPPAATMPGVRPAIRRN